ncbi:MAG TPA: hypothetical protein VGN26_15290, partial [Armatimonadota bacterium]
MFCLLGVGTRAATLDPSRVEVTLAPHAEAVGHPETVSFGLPLPPGVLTDAALVRVLDSSG